MTKFVRQIFHSGIDTIFTFYAKAAIFSPASISIFLMLVCRYRIIKAIVKIIRRLLQHLIIHIRLFEAWIYRIFRDILNQILSSSFVRKILPALRDFISLVRRFICKVIE